MTEPTSSPVAEAPSTGKTPAEGSLDESTELKSLQKEFLGLTKAFDAVRKIKPGSADALDQLEKALASFPDPARLGQALTELRDRARALLDAARAQRLDQFRKIEADWVRRRRAAGEVVHEATSHSWRTGRLEIEMNREQARARAKYNREPMGPALKIRTAEDLDSLVRSAEKQLGQAELPFEAMSEVARTAYQHLLAQGAAAGSNGRVPLAAFYREFRVCLARQELTGKPDRKLASAEFPRWAFLYNLDRYRKEAAAASGSERLMFETGSQHDHQRGLAMVLNGLDPAQDYKSYCYVYGPK
jgi:hypothetical protein